MTERWLLLVGREIVEIFDSEKLAVSKLQKMKIFDRFTRLDDKTYQFDMMRLIPEKAYGETQE